MVIPLTQLTRKNIAWQWDEWCQDAFELLKADFTSAPILAHFDPQLPIIVEMDASDYALGAIISQTNANTQETHPIAFHSRTFSPMETNYETHDKELLAIFDSFKVWHTYLEGSAHPVSVVTDHKNLEYFATTKQLTHRQARWSEYLSGFNYTVKY
jgi:hypothetical protein